LCDLGLPPEQVQLLPNTFDADRFAPAGKPPYLLDRFELTEAHRVILTVARLAGGERYKGYDQILRVLPAIRRRVPEARYMIVGSGADRGRIEALVRHLGLTGAVLLAGYVPDEELGDFYNLCDVFAMPSKGEGFGIVFLEALACGKPVLAGNKDGSVDPLLDGELGVLVDPDNGDEIAKQLTLMLKVEHPLAILRRPEQLRARVIQEYGFARFVERVAGHLEELGLKTAQTETAQR
jgi:glycosyltransferase involved in cell wall biosynthesis